MSCEKKNSTTINPSCRYGTTHPRETLDIFGETALPPSAPILVYLSGGYWLDLSGDVSSYPARPMFNAGVITVVPDYARAPGGEASD